MTTALKSRELPATIREDRVDPISLAIAESWRAVAPFWPLENLIAVNPLQGFEQLPFEDALREAAALFEQAELPAPMLAVNAESIKWLQAFFDEGQATIPMPLRSNGLFGAWRRLARHDRRLHRGDPALREWLAGLPEAPEEAIAVCLRRLRIAARDHARFLTLLLTTLPGWAAHVQYRLRWSGAQPVHPHRVSEADYLAMRIAIVCLLWDEGAALLGWHGEAARAASSSSRRLAGIERAEDAYRRKLLRQLSAPQEAPSATPAAQLVFCIDVRSEPLRRAIEQAGNYETYGFAGFFGVPVRIEEAASGESHASCPVLLQPRHTVREAPASPAACARDRTGLARLRGLKRLYQSVKYTFTTPFMLVEAIGPASGMWMALRSFAPVLADRLRAALVGIVRGEQNPACDIGAIPFEDQCAYGENALRTMGLTRNFAPLVVLCGHGSSTSNNAFATALDCGACGGRHGGANARVLAAILNDAGVREALAPRGIVIPRGTRFIAAQHDTTSDAVALFGAEGLPGTDALRRDLEAARTANSARRCALLDAPGGGAHGAERRGRDWAQVRPEWGLARNAAFIAAPRALTRQIDLDGRCFLHSYDHAQDPDGASLAAILTAPMVVAQWINSQYLFSTLDNVAYGAGSKITKNVTGKIGVMQGNASDLMTGLPLQSVFASDERAYHEPQRLLTIVHAPRAVAGKVVASHDILKTLLGNGWVTLVCVDPADGAAHRMTRDFGWTRAD